MRITCSKHEDKKDHKKGEATKKASPSVNVKADLDVEVDT